ncbi:MAG: hypothetical protein R3300_11140 [Candidatus Promineifilaceae bacterium]|nr:hypothetical protein [Candidatus Promineifilaceae bacterium]
MKIRLTLILVVVVAILVGALTLEPTMLAFGQDGGDDDVAPAPPSIGADIPLTYFGPSPSQVQRELIGPFQLLKSGEVDLDAGTITLPLYEGALKSGEPVWYVLTDTTDKGNAEALGLNWSPKLGYSDVGRAVRVGEIVSGGTVMFEKGEVDFSPERVVVPGDDPPFPPADFQPGAVGDKNYSPLVRLTNSGNHIYNAPMVAFEVTAEQLNSFCEGQDGQQPTIDYSLVHDKVVSICPEEGTVTLALTAGFSFARPVLYLSTEANNALAATLEGAIYAPALGDITVGRDDSAFSAVERIFLFANGPVNHVEGEVNPQRQGLNSALRGEGGPLNVLGGIPTIATDYSPLWDVNLGEWTQHAIDSGYRSRLTEEFAILGFVERGFITGPGGAPYGSTGIIVNCPIVFRFL